MPVFDRVCSCVQLGQQARWRCSGVMNERTPYRLWTVHGPCTARRHGSSFYSFIFGAIADIYNLLARHTVGVRQSVVVELKYADLEQELKRRGYHGVVCRFD